MINCLDIKLVFIFIGLSCFQSCKHQSSQVMYVDVVKVFNEFNLSQELKSKTEKESIMFDARIDSLELVLNTTSRSAENYSPNVLRYNELLSQKEDYLDAMISQSDERIWKQLNVYFKEYGEKNGAKIMVGGNGTGNVLYIDESVDSTEDFLRYANSKYEGE